MIQRGDPLFYWLYNFYYKYIIFVIDMLFLVINITTSSNEDDEFKNLKHSSLD